MFTGSLVKPLLYLPLTLYQNRLYEAKRETLIYQGFSFFVDIPGFLDDHP